ncbi:hypothetical protein ABZU32_17635 [Sphaerisporangium sp. NPDC005288]|uniref:restriction endonuclease subunit S n=1 Tax=Sphaerisporangium sp. NPDC005288 TaxID=3155114 RepID=UPI0033B0CA98
MQSDGWEWIPLKEILAEPIRNGTSPVESQEWTGVKMLGLGCLTDNGFEPRQLKNAPSIHYRNHVAVLRDGDLLVSRSNTRELVGLAGIYRDIGVPCIYPDLMMRLRTSRSYLPEFLELVLRYPHIRSQIVALAQGTSESMVKISGATLGELAVPVVPVSGQRRIMKVIDAVSRQELAVKASIAKLSAISAATVDALMEGMAWDCTLSDAADGAIRNGYSPVESEAWTGVQMLGLGCLTPAGFNPIQLKNAPSSVTADHAAILREGDLLMTRANTRELVGLAGVYRDVGTPCIYPDLMMRIRPSNRCSAEFLAAVLMSTRARRQVRSLGQGTSESMVKISAATVREILVPLPAFEEQNRLLGVLNSFSAQIRDKNAELGKLGAVKQGIVDDLLSGRVSV